MYATHEEDIAFRNPYWDKTFDPRYDPRIIMHDATNLPYQNPSNAAQGRAMWSDYYGMACAKGGVSNQLCGWIRAIPLFTGRITDSQMTLHTACVAVIRSGNERAVQRCKMSWFNKREVVLIQYGRQVWFVMFGKHGHFK